MNYSNIETRHLDFLALESRQILASWYADDLSRHDGTEKHRSLRFRGGLVLIRGVQTTSITGIGTGRKERRDWF